MEGSNVKKIKEAKLSAKGQITVPKEIRKMLSLKNGDSIAFYIDENKKVVMTNTDNLRIEAKDKFKTMTIKKGGKENG